MLLLDAKNGDLPTHEADLTITVEGPEGTTRNVFPHVRAQLLGGRRPSGSCLPATTLTSATTSSGRR